MNFHIEAESLNKYAPTLRNTTLKTEAVYSSEILIKKPGECHFETTNNINIVILCPPRSGKKNCFLKIYTLFFFSTEFCGI
jgi:hypothetical protein